MKAKSLICLSILLFTALSFLSCEDKNEDVEYQGSNESTNQWIYKEISEKYLWNYEIPKQLSYGKDPESFYKNLLYKYRDENDKTGDQFSYMESYEEPSTKASSTIGDLGFEYVAANIDDTGVHLGFIVLYVKSNTNAETSGLKRGQIIWKVDESPITLQNYQNLLKNKDNYVFSVFDEKGQHEIKIKTTPNYEENPVYISKTVYNKNGHKIGYLMYNQFERGDDYKYDIELMQAIEALKNEGITDLVLDLRYNLGGYITSAVNLASAITPNRKSIFAKTEYNPTYQASLIKKYGEDEVLNTYFEDVVYGTSQSIPQLKLNRIYVLATEFSASASELIINGLKPHIQVIHIGTTTVGKDKGSINITPPKNSGIKWQLQPLTTRISNSQGDGNYIYGIKPTTEIDEWEYYFGELGNPSETLLAAAIEKITGISYKTKTSYNPRLKPIDGAGLSLKKDKATMLIDPIVK